VDEALLAEARQAQERLIDAERDAEVARAEFNRAVRRLHLHGASLRELAAGLGLSHQRVHQIVESAGGSRRWLRRREGEQPPIHLACTFCGRSQVQVKKLIAGPSVYICDRCVALTRRVISSGEPAITEVGEVNAVPEQAPRGRCSFCGKYRPQVPGMASIPVEAPGKANAFAGVCTECLDLCDEIITEEFS
jgi:ClpX C4-type zinc finger